MWRKLVWEEFVEYFLKVWHYQASSLECIIENYFSFFSTKTDQSEFKAGPDKLEVVDSFCYLGDMLSAGGECEIVFFSTHVKTAWKKFRELLPVLTSRHLSYKTLGHVYSSCVRSVIRYASETSPLTKPHLQRNDRAMIKQICKIKLEDVATVRSS